MLRRGWDLRRDAAGGATKLGAEKADAIAATGATVVASANPGCSVQLAQHLARSEIEVVHPVELLDRATGWLDARRGRDRFARGRRGKITMSTIRARRMADT